MSIRVEAERATISPHAAPKAAGAGFTAVQEEA